jgi:integrase
MKRAGLTNLRFHDLRHEAVSQFFEMGLNMPKVALISGHRTPAMLFRYTHPRPELIAEKLARAADRVWDEIEDRR